MLPLPLGTMFSVQLLILFVGSAVAARDATIVVESTVVVIKPLSEVTLPCSYTTDRTGAYLIIRWERDHKDGPVVLARSSNGNISPGAGYETIAYLGENCSLILKNPEPELSGTYTVTVDVHNEVSRDVELFVFNETTALRMNNSLSQQSGILSLVFILISWLAASGCAFVFGKQWTRRITTGSQPRQTRFPIQRFRVFRVALGTGFVLGMCLTFTGTVLTAFSLLGLKSSLNMLYIKLGLGIGSTGVVSVIIMTVLGARVALEDTDNEKKRVDHSSQNKLPFYEEIPLMDQSDQRTFKSLQYPANTKFTGMVSTSKKDIYLTTTSTENSSTKILTKLSLFHMDTTSGSQWAELSDKWDENQTFLMVAKYKQGVVICSKVFSPGVFNDSYKYQLIQKPKVNNAGKIVRIKTAISWVREGVNDDNLYVCDTEHGVVAKVDTSEKRLFEFGKDVLKTPRCFVQNSERCFIVADSAKPDLLVFNRKGGFETSMKISVPKGVEEGLEGCNSLDIGPDDKIYASGPFSNNIFVFSADFRFERLLSTQSPIKEGILSLMVHNHSLYVAHEDCIRIYPLSLTESVPSDLYNQSTVYCSTVSGSHIG